MDIVLASHNENKVKEVSQLLGPLGIRVKSLNDFSLQPPEETGNDFKQNSFIKAMYAFENTGLPSLGDDSGFCVDSLNDFPGLCSARFAEALGSYESAFEILNKCINSENKKCHFITSLSFIYKHEETIKSEYFEGRVNGLFTYPARGNNGFGYCPVFTPDGFSQTFSELSDDVRVRINHRYRALEKFVVFMKTWGMDK